MIVTRIWLSLLLIIWMVVTESTPAKAHANLLDSFPADRAVIQVAPAQLELHFSEFMEPELVDVDLFNQKAAPIPLPPPRIVPGDASRIAVALPDLPPGGYSMVWRVLSEDGHPVKGVITFSIGDKPVEVIPPQSLTDAGNNNSHPALILTRALIEAALLLGGGLYLMQTLLQRTGASSLLPSLNRMRVNGSIALLFLLGEAAVLYIKHALEGDPSVWMASPFLVTLTIQFGLICLLFFPNMMTGWYLMLLFALTCSLAFSGHAWGIEPVQAALVTRVIHVLGLALWLGTLCGLLLIFRKARKDSIDPHPFLSAARPMLLRVLLYASLMVGTSGLAMTALQTDLPNALQIPSLWTLLLAGKVLLFLLMAGIALKQSRQWRSDGNQLSPALLRMELAIGLIALLTGVWMSFTAYTI